MMNHSKNPVVLHTDIGTDFDDTWALSMLLCQPWWDLKLVLVDTGDLRYRAALAAKTLAAFGRNDVEIALGKESSAPSTLGAWLKGDELERYSGPVSEDGAGRLIEIVRDSPEPVSLISIGPLSTLAAALDRAPDIAGRIRFTGMFGSIRRGLENQEGQIAEYNVRQDIPAAQKVFAAPWREARITPLDTCGAIRLRGEDYRRIFQSDVPWLAPIREGYFIWRRALQGEEDVKESSILFDTVAVHLARSTEFLAMENLPLSVDDRGFTIIDPSGRIFSVAVAWIDLPGYERFLTEELLSCRVSPGRGSAPDEISFPDGTGF